MREEGREDGQPGTREWEQFGSSVGEEEEVEIQDYPASRRLFDLLSVRKDLEMSM